MLGLTVGEMLRCPVCNRYKPDRCTCNKPDKGELGGSCNRTACQQPGAAWYNHATRKYYCATCAELLNNANRDWALKNFGHDLCTLTTKE